MGAAQPAVRLLPTAQPAAWWRRLPGLALPQVHGAQQHRQHHTVHDARRVVRGVAPAGSRVGSAAVSNPRHVPSNTYNILHGCWPAHARDLGNLAGRGRNRACSPVAQLPAPAQHHKLLPAGGCIGSLKVQRLAAFRRVRQLFHQCIVGPAAGGKAAGTHDAAANPANAPEQPAKEHGTFSLTTNNNSTFFQSWAAHLPLSPLPPLTCAARCLRRCLPSPPCNQPQRPRLICPASRWPG